MVTLSFLGDSSEDVASDFELPVCSDFSQAKSITEKMLMAVAARCFLVMHMMGKDYRFQYGMDTQRDW